MRNIFVLIAAALLVSATGWAQGRKVVASDKAPKAVGPYSQAIIANGFVFCAGQLPMDPATNQIVQGVKAQTEQVLKNLSAVLAQAGTSLENAVKATVYLKSMSDFAAMNEVYGRYFPKDPPARATVAISGLAKDAMVEIDIIAVAKK